MQSYLKTRPVGIQLVIFFGIAAGIFMLVSVIGGIVLAKVTGISMVQIGDMDQWDFKDPDMIAFMRGMLLLQFLGLFVIPSIFFAAIVDRSQYHQYLGLRKPFKPVYWLYALIALLIAIPFIDFIGMLNHKINFGGWQEWMKEMEEKATRQMLALLVSDSVSNLLKNLVFVALFAGIGEELFFRGILQRLFIQGLRNVWIGIIAAAFLFSFFHFQFFGFFPRFILGILLGALYWYSGSLWTAMLAHFVYDAVLIILIYKNPELAKQPDTTLFNNSMPVMAVLSAVLVGALVWAMRKASKASTVEIYTPRPTVSQKLTFDE